MSWVNLDNVYVNKTGDTITGDLSVGGTLTINDGKGTNTTYNVANEITKLRGSVSRDSTKNKSWNQSNWSIDLQHMFGNLYYLQMQRTYSTFGGANGAEILTLDGVRPYATTQLALTGYVATVAVVYGAARIGTDGKVIINSPSYGAAVTILVSGYVLLS